jgi:hypothetical protein
VGKYFFIYLRREFLRGFQLAVRFVGIVRLSAVVVDDQERVVFGVVLVYLNELVLSQSCSHVLLHRGYPDPSC